MRAMQIEWDKPLEARDHPDPEPWEGSYVGTLDDLRELLALVLAGKVPPIPIEARPAEEASVGCEFGKRTLAEARGYDGVAPIPVIRWTAIEPRESTRSGRLGPPTATTANAPKAAYISSSRASRTMLSARSFGLSGRSIKASVHDMGGLSGRTTMLGVG